ncbi:homoserine dehydrogenase [Methyloligella sp. 2.7D]|uniref:homoserine dehydrogenase n=1 Tax=unclassified Methyloligella TaxID=2625955 RepID=UPI00157C6427|nr:homoserine dehydrogenase [Methyloligella sp. GL2]QKP77567.1 homoserine dehydrogenase [Methyloligella sp. GL2]
MSDTLKLGLAGLGTVGCGVLRLLAAHKDLLAERAGRPISVVAVTARDKTKPRDADMSGLRWVDDPVALAADPEIDVFVELMGGENGTPKEAVEAALIAGKHVVTANKALLAHHGTALSRLAEEHGRALNYEAAIAGGIPVVKVMRESLQGNRVSRVYGILNGTCNYILTLMQEEGATFEDALKDAQLKGYAEADPTFDIGGFDSAHKLALLTSLAFGVETAFDQIYVEGIERITPADIEAADTLGYRLKLLGVAVATESGIEQRVHPAMVAKHTPIAENYGPQNCVMVEGDFIEGVMLSGPGAGAGPTASSVVGDLVDIARGQILPPLAVPTSALAPFKKAEMGSHEGSYYLRLTVFDRIGVIAAIATRMAEQHISLESIVQHRNKTEIPGIEEEETSGPIDVVMITHETNEAAVNAALTDIEKDGHIVTKPQMIRIEGL